MKTLPILMREIESWFKPLLYICNLSNECIGRKNGCVHSIPHEDKHSCFGGCDDAPQGTEQKCIEWSEVNTISARAGWPTDDCGNCRYGGQCCPFAGVSCDNFTRRKWKPKTNPLVV